MVQSDFVWTTIDSMRSLGRIHTHCLVLIRVSGFGGLEQWNGMVEWTGLERWNEMEWNAEATS